MGQACPRFWGYSNEKALLPSKPSQCAIETAVRWKIIKRLHLRPEHYQSLRDIY